ncbi:MAG: lamin tail domain-containing protein [Myxococcota bacterium]
MGRLLAATVALSLFGLAACSDTPCEPACLAGQQCIAGTCVKSPFANDASTKDTGGGDVSGSCVAAVAGDLIINEILADPGGQDVNGDGKADSGDDEFIEIVNVSGHAVGLSSAMLRVKTKTFALGGACLEANSARVVFGAESKLALTNGGSTVELLIDGAVAHAHTWGAEGGKKQSLTLTVQLDPDSGWSLHKDVAAAPWSPGTCANGNAFPDCAVVVPVEGQPDAGGDVTEPVGDVVVDVPVGGTGDVPVDGTGDMGADVPAPCGVAPVSGDLLINEVLADPGSVLDANQSGAVDSGEDEFVEILNVSDVALDLTGVRVAEAGGTGVTLAAGSCLQPGQALVVFGKYAGGGDFGGSLVVGIGKAFGLNNPGDSLSVTGASGAVLTSLTFGSAGTTKQSLTRAVDGEGSSEMVQHTKALLSGGAAMSPGRCQNGNAFPDCEGAAIPDPAPDAASEVTPEISVDTIQDATDVEIGPDAEVGPDITLDTTPDTKPACGVKAAAGLLALNEILSDPAGVDVNGDGSASSTQDEFIELVNLTGGDLDLTGVVVGAGPPGAPVTSHTFGSLCLGAFQGVVLFSGGSPTLTKPMAVVMTSGKALGLNNGGETVVVRAADGADIDSYAFTALVGQSWVRIPDGTGAFGKHGSAPDSGGALFSPGTCNDGSTFPFCLQ